LRDRDIVEYARVFAERSRALARQGAPDVAVREEARQLLANASAALDLAHLDDLDWI
jgi:hypothetical protein